MARRDCQLSTHACKPASHKPSVGIAEAPPDIASSLKVREPLYGSFKDTRSLRAKWARSIEQPSFAREWLVEREAVEDNTQGESGAESPKKKIVRPRLLRSSCLHGLSIHKERKSQEDEEEEGVQDMWQPTDPPPQESWLSEKRKTEKEEAMSIGKKLWRSLATRNQDQKTRKDRIMRIVKTVESVHSLFVYHACRTKVEEIEAILSTYENRWLKSSQYTRAVKAIESETFLNNPDLVDTDIFENFDRMYTIMRVLISKGNRATSHEVEIKDCEAEQTVMEAEREEGLQHTDEIHQKHSVNAKDAADRLEALISTLVSLEHPLRNEVKRMNSMLLQRRQLHGEYHVEFEDLTRRIKQTVINIQSIEEKRQDRDKDMKRRVEGLRKRLIDVERIKNSLERKSGELLKKLSDTWAKGISKLDAKLRPQMKKMAKHRLDREVREVKFQHSLLEKQTDQLEPAVEELETFGIQEAATAALTAARHTAIATRSVYLELMLHIRHLTLDGSIRQEPGEVLGEGKIPLGILPQMLAELNVHHRWLSVRAQQWEFSHGTLSILYKAPIVTPMMLYRNMSTFIRKWEIKEKVIHNMRSAKSRQQLGFAMKARDKIKGLVEKNRGFREKLNESMAAAKEREAQNLMKSIGESGTNSLEERCTDAVGRILRFEGFDEDSNEKNLQRDNPMFAHIARGAAESLSSMPGLVKKVTELIKSWHGQREAYINFDLPELSDVVDLMDQAISDIDQALEVGQKSLYFLSKAARCIGAFSDLVLHEDLSWLPGLFGELLERCGCLRASAQLLKEEFDEDVKDRDSILQLCNAVKNCLLSEDTLNNEELHASAESWLLRVQQAMRKQIELEKAVFEALRWFSGKIAMEQLKSSSTRVSQQEPIASILLRGIEGLRQICLAPQLRKEGLTDRFMNSELSGIVRLALTRLFKQLDPEAWEASLLALRMVELSAQSKQVGLQCDPDPEPASPKQEKRMSAKTLDGQQSEIQTDTIVIKGDGSDHSCSSFGQDTPQSPRSRLETCDLVDDISVVDGDPVGAETSEAQSASRRGGSAASMSHAGSITGRGSEEPGSDAATEVARDASESTFARRSTARRSTFSQLSELASEQSLAYRRSRRRVKTWASDAQPSLAAPVEDGASSSASGTDAADAVEIAAAVFGSEARCSSGASSKVVFENDANIEWPEEERSSWLAGQSSVSSKVSKASSRVSSPKQGDIERRQTELRVSSRLSSDTGAASQEHGQYFPPPDDLQDGLQRKSTTRSNYETSDDGAVDSDVGGAGSLRGASRKSIDRETNAESIDETLNEEGADERRPATQLSVQATMTGGSSSKQDHSGVMIDAEDIALSLECLMRAYKSYARQRLLLVTEDDVQAPDRLEPHATEIGQQEDEGKFDIGGDVTAFAEEESAPIGQAATLEFVRRLRSTVQGNNGQAVKPFGNAVGLKNINSQSGWNVALSALPARLTTAIKVVTPKPELDALHIGTVSEKEVPKLSPAGGNLVKAGRLEDHHTVPDDSVDAYTVLGTGTGPSNQNKNLWKRTTSAVIAAATLAREPFVRPKFPEGGFRMDADERRDEEDGKSRPEKSFNRAVTFQQTNDANLDSHLEEDTCMLISSLASRKSQKELIPYHEVKPVSSAINKDESEFLFQAMKYFQEPIADIHLRKFDIISPTKVDGDFDANDYAHTDSGPARISPLPTVSEGGLEEWHVKPNIIRRSDASPKQPDGPDILALSFDDVLEMGEQLTADISRQTSRESDGKIIRKDPWEQTSDQGHKAVTFVGSGASEQLKFGMNFQGAVSRASLGDSNKVSRTRPSLCTRTTKQKLHAARAATKDQLDSQAQSSDAESSKGVTSALKHKVVQPISGKVAYPAHECMEMLENDRVKAGSWLKTLRNMSNRDGVDPTAAAETLEVHLDDDNFDNLVGLPDPVRRSISSSRMRTTSGCFNTRPQIAEEPLVTREASQRSATDAAGGRDSVRASGRGSHASSGRLATSLAVDGIAGLRCEAAVVLQKGRVAGAPGLLTGKRENAGMKLVSMWDSASGTVLGTLVHRVGASSSSSSTLPRPPSGSVPTIVAPTTPARRAVASTAMSAGAPSVSMPQSAYIPGAGVASNAGGGMAGVRAAIAEGRKAEGKKRRRPLYGQGERASEAGEAAPKPVHLRPSLAMKAAAARSAMDGDAATDG